MAKFKSEVFRYFTFGFAAGAALVVASTGNIATRLAHGVVPVAEAQPAQ